MNKLKEIYAGLLLIFALSWILLHLIYIAKWKKVVFGENNKWILRAELVLVSLAVLLGIERFVKDLKE